MCCRGRAIGPVLRSPTVASRGAPISRRAASLFREAPLCPATHLKLIVGLGNPGPEYARTRHNAGFWLVDELARRHGGVFRFEGKHQAELARVRIGGEELWLAKPMTFMNRSGGPVSSVLGFYKMTPAQMLVAHDEIDLPSGTVRLKEAGGHGGHNGLRDLIAAQGDGFWRLRIGVSHPGRKARSWTSC